MVISYCPHCQTAVPFVEEFVGREVFCLGCGNHFIFRGPGLPPPEGCDITQLKSVVIKLINAPTSDESTPPVRDLPPSPLEE